MNKYIFLATALAALVSCSENEFVGDTTPTPGGENGDGAINFALSMQNTTRAGELSGAAAAEKLGGMFVVEGTKGSEATDAPSSTVVFDNYLVGYTANTAGTTESNTHNWEYVGKQTGIAGRMSADTWTALHGTGTAQAQTIKYWDYSQAQYDFIAWSTGTCEATTGDAADGKVKVTRINTGTDLSSTATGKGGFTMTANRAADLLQCYYTDITTVTKGTNGVNYGKPVTLTFKNLSAKVRVALYETVPGYSVKNVMFYSAEASDPTAPNDLGVIAGENPKITTTATLFTTGTDVLPQSGAVTVLYPHIGTNNNTKADYNKASVTVTPGSSTATKLGFGTLTDQYRAATGYEPSSDIFLGITLPTATFAGTAANNYYTAVFPNTTGKALTLRVDYTLVSTDGSAEEIKVYGAKAVVPSTYTVWQPNYAYTYIFKISDNSNGFTSQTSTDPKGLFPITFDAVVANFTEANAEQTTITTVATPSITTYQQGHDHANKDEYSKSQKAGKDATNVKDVYVQVMNNSGATPSLVTDLNTAGKSLLYLITKDDADYVASEAEVMDALQNRTDVYSAASPIVGRNGIKLTSNSHISNTETQIVNGVDDQPITKIAGTDIAAGQVAKIDIDKLTAGTYAYVYCTTVPSSEEKVYQVAAATSGNVTNYYEVTIANIGATPLASESKAAAGKVYFVKNADNSYTFKQTKVGDDVTGLYEATIPNSKASTYTEGNFYFDVYYQNNGAYAVKVIKVVN